MATIAQAKVGASQAKEWQFIDWKAAQEIVYKLQKRIAKAIKVESFNKVKSLQRILTHSFSARVLAVKRVTQNKGKSTPGVDRVIWKTPKQKIQAVEDLKNRCYKASPLRRVYTQRDSKVGNRSRRLPKFLVWSEAPLSETKARVKTGNLEINRRRPKPTFQSRGV